MNHVFMYVYVSRIVSKYMYVNKYKFLQLLFIVHIYIHCMYCTFTLNILHICMYTVTCPAPSCMQLYTYRHVYSAVVCDRCGMLKVLICFYRRIPNPLTPAHPLTQPRSWH